MLSDPACLGNLPQNAEEMLFDPEYWRRRSELEEVSGGRGSAWFIVSGARQWALRHFRRGGFIARLWQDCYVWAGENRVRAFAEWRLLALLTDRGLPVPKPVAARYQRSGLIYRCDLITQRIANAEPLSAVLARGALAAGAAAEVRWRAVGAAVAEPASSGGGSCGSQRAQHFDRREGRGEHHRLRPRPRARTGGLGRAEFAAAAALARQDRAFFARNRGAG